MGFLTIITTCIFLSMLLFLLFIKLKGIKADVKFKYAVLVMLFVEISILTLVDGSGMSLYSSVNIWGLFTTVAAFFMTIAYILKNRIKGIVASVGILTGFYMVSMVNASLQGYSNEILTFYGACYEINLYIFTILLAVKKNPLAIHTGRVLLGLYLLNIVVRAAVNYSSVIALLIEIILFSFLGALFAVPLVLVVRKRFPDRIPFLRLWQEGIPAGEASADNGRVAGTLSGMDMTGLDQIVD